MGISKSIIYESVEKVRTSGLTEKDIKKALEELDKKNPQVANFIKSARDRWREQLPSTLEDQMQFLFKYLVDLASLLYRQQEQEKEGEDYLAYFVTAVLSSWRSKTPYNLKIQVFLLSAHLLTMVDIFRRQTEVNRLEEQFGKSFSREES